METDLAPPAATAENQLEQVRTQLGAMTKKDWALLAIEADVDMRTFYNLVKPEKKPGYDTVYKVFRALKEREAAKQ